jgi:hypothetical protein
MGHWFALGTSGATSSPAALMADGGRWLGCSGARGKKEGGFIGPVARRGCFASPSWPTRAPAWARGGGDVRQGRRFNGGRRRARGRGCRGRVAPA